MVDQNITENWKKIIGLCFTALLAQIITFSYTQECYESRSKSIDEHLMTEKFGTLNYIWKKRMCHKMLKTKHRKSHNELLPLVIQ